MPKILNIERISEGDSAEVRASKLNSNFNSLMNAALTLDRTGVLVRKESRKSATAVGRLADIVDYDAERIDDLEDDMSRLKASSMLVESHYDANGWSYRKWSDGLVQLWGKASGSCKANGDTTLSANLPFSIASVLSWQDSLRTSNSALSVRGSSANASSFSVVVKNDSSSAITATVNAYIIGLYNANGV